MSIKINIVLYWISSDVGGKPEFNFFSDGRNDKIHKG